MCTDLKNILSEKTKLQNIQNEDHTENLLSKCIFISHIIYVTQNAPSIETNVRLYTSKC